jgi:hypothetical protein
VRCVFNRSQAVQPIEGVVLIASGPSGGATVAIDGSARMRR